MLATGAAAVGRDVVLFATNPAAGCSRPRRPLDAIRAKPLAARGVAGIGTLLAAAERARRAPHRLRGRAAGGGDRARRSAPGVEIAGMATFLATVGAGQIVEPVRIA